MMAGLEEFLAEFFVVRESLGNEIPKLRGMVELFQMTQLVNHDIVGQVGR